MDETGVLLRLVRAYSPSGREGPGVRAFVECARRLGLRAGVDAAGNGHAHAGGGRPRTVFLGHVDTVPGRLPVRRGGGRVYGRGAVDAKGALAAALVAAANRAGPGSVEVVAAVGEETDSRGARHLRARRNVDFVIAGEPGHWDGVAVGYRGDLRIRAEFSVPRTHPSSPDPTAPDRAVAWAANSVAVLGRPVGASTFRSRTLKVLDLGSDGDDARDHSWVTVDVRLPPGDTTDRVLREVVALGGEPRLTPLARVEPIEVHRTNPVVRALDHAIREEGGRPTHWRKAGTSDLNLVAPAWGVPGAAYGPGDPHLDHSPCEALSERELGRASRVLERAFSLLATGPTLRVPAGGGG